MPTITCTTAAQVKAALDSGAGSGDIIELGAGATISGSMSSTNNRTFASPITIRNANTANPAIVTGNWEIRGKDGWDLDGITFRSSAVDSLGWPNGGAALRIQDCADWSVTNCTFTGTDGTASSRPGYLQCIYLVNDNRSFEISSNVCERYGIDAIRLYHNCTDGLVEHNLVWNHRVDPARAPESNRHPDMIQGATNVNFSKWTRVTIRNNWLECNDDIYHQGLFAHNENTPSLAELDAQGHIDTVITGNYIKSPGWNCLYMTGHQNFTISGNKLVDVPGGNVAGLCFNSGNSGVVNNNVYPRAPGSGSATNFNYISTQITLGTGANANVISNATNVFPTGWDTDLRNKVGPYANDSPAGSTPAQIQCSATGSTTKVWIGEVVLDPIHTTRYTAILYIPAAAIPYDYVGFRWSQGVVDVSAGNGTTDITTNLPSLPDGTKRVQLTSTGGGSAHTIASGGTFSNLYLYWREVSGGPLSPASTPALSFTFTPAQGPTVTSVTLNNANYTVGQTATATVNYTLGTGTLSSIAYQWKLDGVNVGTNQNTYTTVSAGALTCVATVTTTVSSSQGTSAASTVAPAAVPPSISAVTLDKLSYFVGDTATATPTYTQGSGTLTSVTYQWFQNGIQQSTTSSQFVTSATGTLFARVTVLTSVDSATKDSSTVQIGTPPPSAPAAGSWSFVDIEEVFTGRFTGQFRFPVGSVVSQSGLLGCQWSFDRITWNNTTEVGVWTDGRRLFQLLPSAGSTNDHTVGYEVTSAPVYIRIATASGTSGASVDGLTFTGGPTPPPPPVELPGLADADWEFLDPVAVPGLINRFAGVVRATTTGAFGDDSTWIAVQWVGSAGVWADTAYLGTDGDGQKNWQFLPTRPGEVDHTVQYDQDRANISIRYTTTVGTSLISLTAKTLEGPAAPAPTIPAGTPYTTAGDQRMVINGVRIVAPRQNRPANIRGTIDVFTDDDGTVTVNPPPLQSGVDTCLMSYNGHWYTSTTTFTFDYVDMSPGKNFGTLRSVSSDGSTSTSRYFFVPDIPA